MNPEKRRNRSLELGPCLLRRNCESGLRKENAYCTDIWDSLYELGTQGHLEDIAIASDMQGKKFGVKLIQALDHIAKEVGCYKVINPFEVFSKSPVYLLRFNIGNPGLLSTECSFL